MYSPMRGSKPTIDKRKKHEVQSILGELRDKAPRETLVSAAATSTKRPAPLLSSSPTTTLEKNNLQADDDLPNFRKTIADKYSTRKRDSKPGEVDLNRVEKHVKDYKMKGRLEFYLMRIYFMMWKGIV
eukprot:TRINITY_DN2495_c0_g1_i15.p1 TRINITY_DN2495_c0_g1~~TRINITY_DN2495_c0_g1_i15.p1  ORF type:complete len:128 (+),score=31.42 TRINITY_DN2495_c0_g1_i15:196-579(+)